MIAPFALCPCILFGGEIYFCRRTSENVRCEIGPRWREGRAPSPEDLHLWASKNKHWLIDPRWREERAPLLRMCAAYPAQDEEKGEPFKYCSQSHRRGLGDWIPDQHEERSNTRGPRPQAQALPEPLPGDAPSVAAYFHLYLKLLDSETSPVCSCNL